jgi:hypothetical protein
MARMTFIAPMSPAVGVNMIIMTMASDSVYYPTPAETSSYRIMAQDTDEKGSFCTTTRSLSMST